MEKTEGFYQSEPTLGEKVDRLTELMEGKNQLERKSKKFRLPAMGKVSNSKLRNGFATVVEIAENDAVSFTREQIIDGTVKLNNTYHAVSDDDILTYKGKPLLIIPKKNTTPYNPNRVSNNTFGQKHIMSRMMNEIIDSGKKKIGALGISIGGLILGAALIYALIGG